MSLPRRWCFAAALVLASCAPRFARAGDSVVDARAAYDRGADAYDARDYAAAADAFARADELAPNDTVLKLALTAATRAGVGGAAPPPQVAVLAMNLATRARTRNVHRDLSDSAVAKYERGVASIRVACAEAASCSAVLDGAPVVIDTSTWVAPGTHVVEFRSTIGVDRQVVEMVAGSSRLVVSREPAPLTPSPSVVVDQAPPVHIGIVPREASEPSAPAHGISPAWFWIGAGVTVVLAGATTWSGADTLAKHADFVAHRNDARAREGTGAETRTNVLIGATAASAVITAAVGLFLVRWSTRPITSSRLLELPAGATF